MQDLLPADGSIYMPNMDNKMSSIMDALKAWEKKRGISFSYRGRYVQTQPKKTEDNKEKTKEKPSIDRPITVPRTPGRKKQFTAAEKKQRKNESDRQYRAKNNAASRAKSKAWRDNLTPKQRAVVRERHRQWKAKRLLAVDQGNGSTAAGVSLANAHLSGEAGAVAPNQNR